MIEPVTHQGNAKVKEDQMESEEEEMVRECARKAEDSVLKAFLKIQKHQKSSEKVGSNQSLSLHKVEEEGSFHAFDFDLSERSGSNLLINSHPSLDTDSFYDNSFVKIGDQEGISFYGGTLSDFDFHLKIEKNELKSSQGLFRMLSIGFMCKLNKQVNLKVTLRYPFFHVQEEEIEPVIGLRHFVTDSFILFYLFYGLCCGLFAAFWFRLAKNPWQWWSIVGSMSILFSTYFSVQVSVAINNWRRPFFDLVQRALATDVFHWRS